MLSRKEQERTRRDLVFHFPLSLAVLPLTFSVSPFFARNWAWTGAGDEELSLSKWQILLFLIHSIWSHTAKSECLRTYAGHRWAKCHAKAGPTSQGWIQDPSCFQCAAHAETHTVGLQEDLINLKQIKQKWSRPITFCVRASLPHDFMGTFFWKKAKHCLQDLAS